MKYATTVRTLKPFSPGFVLFAILLLIADNLAAQPARITHVIEKIQKDNTQYLGRDLWFTMAENYVNQVGKYYTLYVTSPNNTTVNIEVTGKGSSKNQIIAGQVFTYNVPLAWEVTSSGVVEQKGIHVWSDDADLTAYLLSRNPSTSDGMLIIPTTGWGTEYVVGAYGSLWEGYGGGLIDFPSEFSIVANQDNTVCKIVPNVDIRVNGMPDHKAGVAFTEVLNKGECIQYQAVLSQDCANYDVTGSVVTTNYPVGIIGASQCPNIPCTNEACDHICEMIPPVRTWAKTYLSVPFDTRVAGDTYLVIATVPGQVITRNKHVYWTATNKYDFNFEPDISDASLWESSAPFFLAQYINSATYEAENGGDPNNTKGDPAMVVINSVEQYVPHIIFQTPDITGPDGFSNYCNIMVDTAAVNTTLFDGAPIGSVRGSSRMPIPYSNYRAYRISQVAPGKHEVISDSGVGVYIYGYGTFDSYAWSGALGLKTFNDPDTIPPVAITSGSCFDALVTMADKHIAPPASQISEMKVDSVYNMQYGPDPSYQIGITTDSTYYHMNVIDITKPAFLQTETHDFAGNRTIVTSTYTPQSDTITPPVNNFGSGNLTVKTSLYFTITNTGTIPFTWQYIKLLLGNQGFTIDSGLVPNSPIPVGGSRIIKVGFQPFVFALKSDTLELSDGCVPMHALLIGTGGAPDFTVTGEDFGCQLVGTTTKLSDVSILNVSKSLITIDTITIDDPVHFGFSAVPPPITNTLPAIIASKTGRKIEFSFTPDKRGLFQTTAHFHSAEIGWKTATLQGSGCAPSASIGKDTSVISECGTPVPFVFTITSTGNVGTRIANVFVTGDTAFMMQPPALTDLFGNKINPGQLPFALDVDQVMLVYLTFTPPPKASGKFQASIFAVSDKGDTTKPFATAEVTAIYRELEAITPTVNIPASVFGSGIQTGSFRYCDTLTDSVMLQNMVPISGPFNKSFSITGYSVGGVAQKLPITLGKNDCVDITVQFDPSVSPVPVQTQDYAVVSNACISPPKATAVSGVSLGSPIILGVDFKPAILSCEARDTIIKVFNPDAVNSPPMTVISIAVTGKDSANFIFKTPASTTLPGLSSLNIPITFVPTPFPGPLPRTYNANIEVTLKTGTGIDTTLIAAISGSANGMSAIISSNFAVQSSQPDENTFLALPINIAFTKNGLLDPVDEFGITQIKLTYSYNNDILDLVLDAKGLPMVSGLPSGWNVDGASKVAAGTLTLILDGSAPLTDAQASAGVLGQLTFAPMLAKIGEKATTVTLAPPVLVTSSGTQVGNCLAISQTGTQFSLIYSCGDSSLAFFLTHGTAPSMIKPVSLNPVSASNGGVVNFQYVTKHEGVVTLSIYDELGREAARVVRAQFHPAGTYEVRADVSKFSSGSYIYRFQLDNHHAISGRLVVAN